MSLAIIWRGDTSQRVFPLTGAEAPPQTPSTLLALSDAELPRYASYSVWKLTVPQRFARLWRHQRTATEAELAGRWAEADFFWNLVYDQFNEVASDNYFWRELAETCATGGSARLPSDLRDRFVNEVLIDTHCALYNGYAMQEAASGGGRANTHFSFIRRLLDLGTMPEEQRLRLVLPLAAGQLKAGEQSENYEQAAAGCELLLKHQPDNEEYQTHLFVTEYAKTLKQLTQKPALGNPESYLETVRNGIWRLDDLNKRHAYNLTRYELTARLYLLEALKLSETGKITDALVALEKSLTYAPTCADAWKSRETIAGKMQALQERRAEIEADYLRAATAGQDSDKPVDLSGHLWHQVSDGFEPARRYALSPVAALVRAGWHKARTHYLWKEIMLEVEHRDELAPALWEAVSGIIESKPADEAAIGAAWREAVANSPGLDKLDSKRVLTFLSHHILGVAVAPKSAAEVDEQFASDAPRLPVQPAATSRSGEPFRYWLFMPKDYRIKAQAFLAILLLIVAGVVGAREYLAGRARDAAFQQVLTAVDGQDYQTVIDSAEAFLDNPPVAKSDGREEQVRRLYDEAVVRWVSEQPGELSAACVARLERYRRLTLDHETKGGK